MKYSSRGKNIRLAPSVLFGKNYNYFFGGLRTPFSPMAGGGRRQIAMPLSDFFDEVRRRM
jgi:hypothetical protein